jgi:hypothetical protein
MITCPFCNSLVETPASGTTRVLCPRCGERFPYRESEGSSPTEPVAPAANQTTADPDVPMPVRFSNRNIVLSILGVMTVMALVGLFMSLETVNFRRENDRHITKEQVIGIPLVIKVVAGLWMAGLVLVVVGVSQRGGAQTAGVDRSASDRRRWLFAGGLALAVLGIVLIIFSGPLRRRSSQLPGDVPSNQQSAVALAPAQLEAIRYLPADTNIVAGIHLANLLQTPETQALLDRIKFASFDLSAERVQKLTGLKREDLDHVVVGVKLEDEIVPRLTVLVRTRTRFDPEAVRAALHAVPTAESRRANRYHFKLDQPAVEIETWLLPEEKLLVFGLTRADVEAVSERPQEGVKHLAPALGKMLDVRLDPAARVWVVGNIDHWDRTLVSKMQNAGLAQKVRSFDVGLIPSKAPEKGLQLRADVNCVDAEGARAIAKYLNEHKPEGVELSLPEPQGDWLGMKAQIKPDDVSKLLPPRGQ